jgi:hypothetical protein
MNLQDAKAAINTLGTKTAVYAAYASYAAGHDDKHRSATKAYASNHGAADPNAPQGYYQKTGTEAVQTGTVVKSVWGKAATAQPVIETRVTLSDLSVDDEKELLWHAISTSAGDYYTNKKAGFFLYGRPIPAGFKGFTFEGGGRAFPKIGTPCTTMIMVFATGGNVQLVTHFPASATFIGAQTAL